MDTKDAFGPIKKGLLEFVVLQVISAKEVYAADILQILVATQFATQEGTLYPLLSHLRREGFVEYEWIESDAGPPRKYYRLTDRGKTHLEKLDEYWQTLTVEIKKLGKQKK